MGHVPPKPKQIYPWEEWMDGKEHVIQYRVNFQVLPRKMIQMLYTRALRKDTNVKVRQQDTTIEFIFIEDADEFLAYEWKGPVATIARDAVLAQDPNVPHCSVCNSTIDQTSAVYGECLTGTFMERYKAVQAYQAGDKAPLERIRLHKLHKEDIVTK